MAIGAATSSCGPFSIHASASSGRSKQVLLSSSPFSLSPIARRTQRWMVPVSLDPGKRTLSIFCSFKLTFFQYSQCTFTCVWRSQEHLSFSAAVIWHGPLAFLNAIALSSSFQMSQQATSSLESILQTWYSQPFTLMNTIIGPTTQCSITTQCSQHTNYSIPNEKY